MFDPTKPVETQDGRPARIIATNFKAPGGESIVALIEEENGERLDTFFENGRWMRNKTSDGDLINVDPTTVSYLNLGQAYGSFEAAKKSTNFEWPILKVTKRGDHVLKTEVVDA